jgi:hypothetical protein
MKNSILTFALLLLGSAAYAQTDSIYFEAYEIQMTLQKDALASLEAPQAYTTCEEEDAAITIRLVDAKFSGGKHGTIERTWIATDACGNEKRTVQYLMLTD